MPSTARLAAAAGSLLLALGAGLLADASPADAGVPPAEDLIASSDERLFRFSSASPGTVTEVTVAEPAGLALQAIATRPANQTLYGLFENEAPQGLRAKGGPQPEFALSLATINPTTGAVGTPVPLVQGPGETSPGSPVTVAGAGHFWSMDFDPVTGLARLQAASTENLAANADTGVTAIDDPTDIVGPNNGTIRGTAVTAAGATFGVTSQALLPGQLVRQDPVADGTLTVVGSDLGIALIDTNAGFEVGNNGVAYLLASTEVPAQPGGLSARPKGLAPPVFLHVVDLQTGVASAGVAFGSGVSTSQAQIESLTAAPVQAQATTTTTSTTLATTSTAAVSPTSRVLARTGDEKTRQSAVGMLLIAVGGVAIVAAARLRTRRA